MRKHITRAMTILSLALALAASSAISSAYANVPCPAGLENDCSTMEHSGNFVQLMNGDFDLVVPQGDRLVHYRRDNHSAGLPWHKKAEIPLFGNTPIGVALIPDAKPKFGYGINYDYEILIVRMRPAPEFGTEDFLRLYQWREDWGFWDGPHPVYDDQGLPITGVTGNPALIRSTVFGGGYGFSTGYDLIVPQGSKLTHYWNLGYNHGADHGDYNNVGPQWSKVADLALPGGWRISYIPTASALIQSNLWSGGIVGVGNAQAVVRLRRQPPIYNTGDYLALYTYSKDWYRAFWTLPLYLYADGLIIGGVTADPALIQSTWGDIGNFELVVPQGDHLVHYYRSNDVGPPSDYNSYQDHYDLPWHKVDEIPMPQPGGGGPRGIPIKYSPTGVSFFQSDFHAPDTSIGNFEMVVRLTPNLDPFGTGDYLAYYWFDSSARQWNGPYPIYADGQLISGVTGF